MTSSLPEVIPTHTYEAVEGTQPHAHVAHEPRTMTHTTTAGDDSDLGMMTEIGDGVFVAWSTCRRCGKQVADCKDPGGPVEPEYITRWRHARFERELNERPEPTYTLLPAILEWVRERGYTVKKAGERKPKATPVAEVNPEAELPQGEAEALTPDEAVETPVENEPEIAEQIDAGLDATLDKVRAARGADIDPGF